jgi:hypothetical protein
MPHILVFYKIPHLEFNVTNFCVLRNFTPGTKCVFIMSMLYKSQGTYELSRICMLLRPQGTYELSRICMLLRPHTLGANQHPTY